MGIPYYFSYLIRNHASIIHKFVQSVRIHNLFIDANSIIYEGVAIHDTAEDIINFVITKLDNLILDVNPLNTCMIAFDGVAPVSKLDQQRARRFKKRYDIPDEPKQFNTIEITPGTVFMHVLNERIGTHFKPNPRVVYSGCFQVGEGEHKIMNYMRNNIAAISNETNAIYGLDSDLIMLALTISSKIPNILLIRETPHFIAYVDRTLEPNALYTLNISDLGRELYEETKCSVDDYIFACFLLGNDFLPHFPALNIRTGGVTKILDAFATSRNVINPYTHKIDWLQFKSYISHLAHNEHVYIKTEMDLRDANQRNYYPSKTKEELKTKLNLIPTYERELEKRIEPSKPGWENRYYSLLFNVTPRQVTAKFIKKVCMNYLYGLEWTYKYYTQPCPDWRWSYSYYYPPLLVDLLKYIPDEPEYDFIPYVMAETVPINELTQLCYVLPPEHFRLLPPELAEKLLTKHKNWYISPDDEPDFLWAFCKYFWESHVVLPEIPLEKLERLVSKYN